MPGLAADFPTALHEEEINGQTFWTTEVPLKQGVQWSDGTDVTAEDFVFTANTVRDLQLTGNWPSIVDPDYFDHAEAVDSYNLKIYFKKKPGLARWQFGLAFMSILSPGLLGAGGGRGQTSRRTYRAAEVPLRPRSDGEPTAGGFRLCQVGTGRFRRKVPKR